MPSDDLILQAQQLKIDHELGIDFDQFKQEEAKKKNYAVIQIKGLAYLGEIANQKHDVFDQSESEEGTVRAEAHQIEE